MIACRVHGGSAGHVRSAALRRVEMERLRAFMRLEVEWRRERFREAETARLVDVGDVLELPVEQVARSWNTCWALAVFDAPELAERHDRRLTETEDAAHRRTRQFMSRERHD